MVDCLKDAGRENIQVFGGGGGTITDKEIDDLHEKGVRRIYSVEDGRHLGLVGMIRDMMTSAAAQDIAYEFADWDAAFNGDSPAVARLLTCIESAHMRNDEPMLEAIRSKIADRETAPILGITGGRRRRKVFAHGRIGSPIPARISGP